MTVLRLSLAAAALMLAFAAQAQTAPTRIEQRFSTFAGSGANSTSLVTGLRTGSAIKLTGSGETTTFTSPTKPMGYGNITRALDLAQRQLAAGGITDPSPKELQAALMGGTVSGPNGEISYQGVLQMRADGMGWGQIAKAEGTKLGPVVSSIKSAHTKVAALPTTSSGSTALATPVSKSTTVKGITTAAGSGVAGTASGKSHKGIVTADGSIGGAGQGHSSAGRGLVTAAGGAAGGVSTAGVHTTHTSGVVTGAGASAATVTTAQGGGNAGGNGHGKGKGGG